MSDQPNPTGPDEFSDRDIALEKAFSFLLGPEGWSPSKLARPFHFYLAEKGWKPSTLAKESGVSIGVVRRAVKGDVPSVETLQRLCIALEVDLWEFFLMVKLLDRRSYIARLKAMFPEIPEAEPTS